MKGGGGYIDRVECHLQNFTPELHTVYKGKTVIHLLPFLFCDIWVLEWQSVWHAKSCSYCGRSDSRRHPPRHRWCAWDWTCPTVTDEARLVQFSHPLFEQLTQNASRNVESYDKKGTTTNTHKTHLFCNFSTVVKVIKSEDPLLTVVILHRNITLQVLWWQKCTLLYLGHMNDWKVPIYVWLDKAVIFLYHLQEKKKKKQFLTTGGSKGNLTWQCDSEGSESCFSFFCK